MQQLSQIETALLETVDASSMLPQVQAWSVVNTGTGNLAGLKVQAGMLADAFSVLPGGAFFSCNKYSQPVNRAVYIPLYDT